MKIPTLIALVILSVLILVGISTKSYIEGFFPVQVELKPKFITHSNFAPNSLTVSWLTDLSSPTKIIYTTDKNFFKDLKAAGDDRDKDISNHTLHFVTLSDLQPNTTYYYKIGAQFFLSTPLQFTTPYNAAIMDDPPLVGSVLDDKLQPISDALVTLETEGYTPLITYTGLSGNFVLPVKPVFNKNNLSEVYDFTENPEVSLSISKDNLSSKVELRLDLPHESIPPIILGENFDLRDFQSTGSADVRGISKTIEYNFDVNNDGKINTIDISTIQNNIGKIKFAPKTDVSQDGKVDQQDLDLIREALQNNP